MVFTLGSSAVYAPGGFYEQSLAAAQKLGVRAVLLTGIGVNQKLPAALPAGIFATPLCSVFGTVSASGGNGASGWNRNYCPGAAVWQADAGCPVVIRSTG